jgi:hypothetical protein
LFVVAATQTTQNKVVPIRRSVQDLRDLILTKWLKGDAQVAKLQTVIRSARLEIGLMLVELRERIEAGEAGDRDWWAWCRNHLADRSRKDIERLLAIASSDDPAAALEAQRAKSRTGMARLRKVRAEEHGANIVDVSANGSPTHSAEITASPTLGPISRAKIEEVVEMFLDLNAAERDVCMLRLEEIYRSQEGYQDF